MNSIPEQRKRCRSIAYEAWDAACDVVEFCQVVAGSGTANLRAYWYSVAASRAACFRAHCQRHRSSLLARPAARLACSLEKGTSSEVPTLPYAQLTDAAPGEPAGIIRARAGARTLLWGSGTSTWNQPANPRKHERT